MKQRAVEATKRLGHGYQSRVADAIGVRAQTVNKWVHGQTLPQGENWENLRAFLISEGLFPSDEQSDGSDVMFTDAEGNVTVVEAKRHTPLVFDEPTIIRVLADLTAEVHAMHAELAELVAWLTPIRNQIVHGLGRSAVAESTTPR